MKKKILFTIFLIFVFNFFKVWGLEFSGLIQDNKVSKALYDLAQVYGKYHPDADPCPDKQDNLDQWNKWLQKNFLRPSHLDHQTIEGLPQDPYYEHYSPFYEQLNLIQEKKPVRLFYDALVIFGGTPWHTLDRFLYGQKLWEQGIRFEKIIYINGQRKLDEKETEWMQSQFSESVNFQHEAAQKIWEHKMTDTPLKNRLEILTIPAPSPEKRANTQDTVKEFFKNPSYQSFQTVLFISNQPYGPYQSLTVTAVLKELNIKDKIIETVYPPLRKNPVNNIVFLDTVARQFYTAIHNQLS